jgi:HupE / UreJ protein
MAILRLIQGLAVVLWACGTPAQAHLLVAQHGTLNLVGDGAFMVMSLPVSAFAGVDDDGDGRLSVAELRTHQANIIARVHHGIALWEETGARPLQGLMVNLASPDESPATPSAQLMVLGRFALAAQDQSLRLRVDLFGTTPGEQTFQVKVLRGGQAQWLVFSPAQPEHGLFAPKWELFLSFTQWGALHIFAGFDHLLFALVVLVGGWGWRHVLWALSCFTLGHALTLVATVWGLLAVPAAIVEPAIAVTIVGMAGFDWRMRYLQRPWAHGPRMALVFCCALIHGLGLGSSLTELGLDTQHRWLSLVGFNVGVELGQMAVMGLFSAVALAVRRLWGTRGCEWGMHGAPVMAIVVGSVWLVQRLVT